MTWVHEPVAPESPLDVLIVDDEPAHAELMRRSVGEGFQVDVCATLGAARERLRGRPPPHLVLADLNLRDGRGYELLPGAGQAPAFPLVVLTSHGDEATAALAIKAGAVEYLVKTPENLSELPRIAARVLREWQLVVERRAADEALRDSEERFRVLFAAAPDAYLIHDLEGVFIDANPAAERLFGIPVAKIRGAKAAGLGVATKPSVAVLEAHLARQRRGEAAGPDLIEVTTADGARHELEIRTTPFALRSGSYVVASLRDVTRQRRTEIERRSLEAQLAQASKLEAMGRLAGGVAHDFNNILTGILGFTELIAMQVPEADPLLADVAEIRVCAEKAASLTGQLLAFSRKQVIEAKTFDANDLVERASRMLERLIGEDIELEITTVDEPSLVSLDPNQLEQVLVNLTVNARDAMPRGGRLAIRIEHVTLTDEDCRLRVDARPERYVVIEVYDTGLGMTDDVLKHIFEPFFSTKADKGTGLGLPTSYGIVRQGGGFIDVTTQLGVGSRFRVYLPAAEGPERESEPAEFVAASSGGTESILLVEDDATLRALVGRFLRQRGYEVRSSQHPGDAVLLLEDPSVKVDLLLTDVILPTMNGPTLYQRLAKIRGGLRVLFMSGYSDTEALTSALQAGDLVAKPFSLEALAKKVREVLDEPRRAG